MNKKKHILFLCGWYPSRVLPENGDFIERHAAAVALQHTVTVIHCITDANCIDSTQIVSKTNNGVTTHIAYIPPTKNLLRKTYLFFKALRQCLAKVGVFDMVHLHELYPFGFFAMYLKSRFKTPYIITEHWTGYHQPQVQNIAFFQKIISRKIAKSAAFICPVSNHLGKAMQQFQLKGQYHSVPNVVDTSLFVPNEKKEGLRTFIHISSMNDAHKNVSGILRTIAKLQQVQDDFTVKFIGVHAAKFLSSATALKISPKHCQFIEHMPQKTLVSELQTADCLLLFSNYENLPCVVLEAFSCGVPVIATDVGGIGEYFPAHFGSLIKAKDEDALLQEMKTMQRNSSESAAEMHAYAQTHFSLERIAEDYTKLYEKALINNL